MPSTIEALSSIGALAAITTWLQDSSWLRFIEIASRSSWLQGVPSSFWKRTALAIARGRLASASGVHQAVDEGRAQHPVRMAVDLRGHHRVGDRAAQVDLLDRRRLPGSRW